MLGPTLYKWSSWRDHINKMPIIYKQKVLVSSFQISVGFFSLKQMFAMDNSGDMVITKFSLWPICKSLWDTNVRETSIKREHECSHKSSSIFILKMEHNFSVLIVESLVYTVYPPASWVCLQEILKWVHYWT